MRLLYPCAWKEVARSVNQPNIAAGGRSCPKRACGHGCFNILRRPMAELHSPESDAQPLTEHYYELLPAGFEDTDDQFLYHYARADVALNAVLPGRTLRLNPYAVMRDPLENKDLPLMLRFSLGTQPERLPLREAQELLWDVRGHMKILSLTMDAKGYEDVRLRAFGRGYARPRMWEHYADAHRGVCLAFSAECLTGPFLEGLRTYGAANCGPVKYTEGGFVVSDGRLIDADRLTDETAARVLTDHLLKHDQDFFFLKLLDWETEYEYRFILFSPGRHGPLDVNFGACLRAVILGEQFDPKRVPLVRDLAKELGVHLVQVDWRSGRPSVIAIP